jgi:PIN domain nuclease of toxin-antitoxin system
VKPPLLLDTCVLIWMAAMSAEAARARAILKEAYDEDLDVYLSPFSAWELGMLAAKGRLASATPPRVFFARLLALPGLKLAQLTPDILISSSELPGEVHSDPADRVLIATARDLGMRLLTRDRKILDYAAKGHVMALAC